MSSHQPDWNTPARLNGLPCTNWKRRSGVTLDGTVADCIARWLSLQGWQKRDCSLGWGPNAAGRHGTMSGTAMEFFVRKNGIPPQMAAARGGQPERHVLQVMAAITPFEPPGGTGKGCGDGKTIGIAQPPKSEDLP